MRRLFLLLLAVTVLTGASARADSVEGIQFGNYKALVIGINAYAHLPRLDTPVNDASAVHDLLRRQYGYESTLLLNPDRTQLVEAMDKLRAELTDEDNLLIYYAGHGFLDRPTGEGFWLTVNAKPDSQVEWLPISTVTRLLKASQAKHILVVADSCYSGVLVRDAPIALRVGAERRVELERLSRKRARKALTSGGLEPVVDGGGDGHSIFTRAFIDALRDNDKIIDGYQLYHELRQRVVVNADQTPEYSDVRLAGDEGGDYLFVPVNTAPPAASAPAATGSEPGAAAMELAFWQSIQNSQFAGDYQAYLARYPDGNFAPLARNRIRSLSNAAVPSSANEPGETKVAMATPKPPTPARAPVDPPDALKPLNAAYVTLRNTNVRASPTVDAPVLATLGAGEEVFAEASTADRMWLKVKRDNRDLGYVFSALLKEKKEEPKPAVAVKPSTPAPAPTPTPVAVPAPAPAATPSLVPRLPSPSDVAKTMGSRPSAPSTNTPSSSAASPPAQVAVVVPPPAPKGPDGPWQIKIKVTSFEEGEHGKIDKVVQVAASRLKTEVKDYFLVVNTDLGFHGDTVEGNLLINLGSPWRPFYVEVRGRLSNDGFSNTYSAFARDFRASNYRTLDVELSLKRN